MAEDELPVRNAGEDAVRVLGLVAVVASIVWPVDPVLRWTASWGLTLIFLIGGYYWFSGPSVRDDVRRWFLSIGRPYLFWWTVACLVYLAREALTGGRVELKVIALAAWGGLGSPSPWTGFWVVSGCFVAMIVVQISMRAGWWWTLGFAYTGLVVTHVEPEVAWSSPLAVVPALACTGFALLGIGLREVQPHLRRPALIGAISLVLGLAGVLLPANHTLNVRAGEFGTPGLNVLIASLIGCGLLLVGSAVGPRIPPAIGRPISALARCNVAVLLSFGIVLYLRGTTVNASWSDFLVALVLPLVVALLTLRSRWAPWIHGIQESSYRGSSHKRFRGAMF